MPETVPCPNCDDGCIAELYCDGCEQTICRGCWAEHNEDAPCHMGEEDDDA